MKLGYVCKHCGHTGTIELQTRTYWFDEISKLAVVAHKQESKEDCRWLTFAVNVAMAASDTVDVTAELKSAVFNPTTTYRDGTAVRVLFLFPIQ
jgi:hypothetical protein